MKCAEQECEKSVNKNEHLPSLLMNEHLLPLLETSTLLLYILHIRQLGAEMNWCSKFIITLLIGKKEQKKKTLVVTC